MVGHAKAGRSKAAHDIFDAYLPLIRYEQQQGVGLAVRKYVLAKRGAIAQEAQRRPAAPLTATARGEVDFLLERLSRHDARAAVARHDASQTWHQTSA